MANVHESGEQANTPGAKPELKPLEQIQVPFPGPNLNECGTDLLKKKLPKIEDILADNDMAERQNELNILLNREPPTKWLAYHPIVKIKSKDANGNKIEIPMPYLPIARIEWLLTSIFLQWRLEVKEVKQMFNAVVCTVRLYYQDPLTQSWAYQDGVGAMDVQTVKGASAAEMDKIVPAAVQKAAPAAEAYAMKDAAEKIGRLFGKDLARADKVGYDNLNDRNFTPESDKPLN